MTSEQQAIYLNALPLLALGLAYLGAAASLVPTLVRARRRLRDLELALVLGFPCGGLAAVVLGVLVLREREPIGGNGWPGLVAVLLAAVPVLAFFARFRDRTLLLTAAARAREAEARGRLRDAATLDEAAHMVVDRATGIARVEFGALLLVEREGKEARGILARTRGRDEPWFSSLRLDLVNETSGVSSAYHEAAPFSVYDARASSKVNSRLVERTGARSLLYVPLLADRRVVAVVVLASLGDQKVFSTDEVAELQSLAAEAAPVIQRLRSRTTAQRDALVAGLAARVRETDEPDAVLSSSVRELAEALGADRCLVRLGDSEGRTTIAAQWHRAGLAPIADSESGRLVTTNLAMREQRTIAIADLATTDELGRDGSDGRQGLLELGTRAVVAVPLLVFGRQIGALAVHRASPGPWDNEDVGFLEAAARELAFGVHTSQLVREGELRLARQAALLRAAHVLTSELEFERLLQRLVDEVVVVAGADAADCRLFDEGKRVLRCRAVHGLPPEEVGREAAPDGPVREVVETGKPVLRRDLGASEALPPGDAGFAELIAAPIVVDGTIRGVLETCTRSAGRFSDGDVELVDTFASLASLALANAEAFEERSRQARIQRGFYRIASVLGTPLSLSATLDALAHAAADAFGGRFAAAIGTRADGIELLGSWELPRTLHEAIAAGLDETAAVLAHAAEERRVLASRRIASDERFSPRWRALSETCGFGSLLVVPVEALREQGAVLVVVFFEGERTLRDEDLELAHHLAQAARGSLERSSLFEAERTSRSLAQQLARTGSVLATELDPAAVLDEVVEQAPVLLGADGCAVRMLEGGELVVAAALGPGADAAVGVRGETTGWLAGEVAQSRRPVQAEDASSDPSFVAADPMLAAGLTSYLGVPLVGPEGTLHGVLSVYAVRPRTWRAEEVEALLALAANTSAALSNAELYQRVALEKERSAAILENIADGIVAVDREGRTVLWNRAAEGVTGVPASEALGRDPEQLLGRKLAGGTLVPLQRGGGEVWLSVTEAVMRDPAGAVAGRILAFRDISAERLVEEMKSAFVSTVSHGLRGPLTSIYGFAKTLVREDVLFGDEERRVFLDYIASESERLTGIVDALLAVAQLDTGDLQVELAPTEVAPVLNEVVTNVNGGDANGHDFVLELPPEPLAAECDPDKLRQVLAQLVDNAVKYSPGGGRVTVTARRKTDTVEFQVADEGIGIPEGEHERIFRKFYRAADDRGGTGIGLFIAQGLVQAMGGRIRVESEEGEGARFAFELPAARV